MVFHWKILENLARLNNVNPADEETELEDTETWLLREERESTKLERRERVDDAISILARRSI